MLSPELAKVRQIERDFGETPTEAQLDEYEAALDALSPAELNAYVDACDAAPAPDHPSPPQALALTTTSLAHRPAVVPANEEPGQRAAEFRRGMEAQIMKDAAWNRGTFFKTPIGQAAVGSEKQEARVRVHRFRLWGTDIAEDGYVPMEFEFDADGTIAMPTGLLRLLEALAGGLSLRRACDYAGLPHRVIRRLIDDHNNTPELLSPLDARVAITIKGTVAAEQLERYKAMTPAQRTNAINSGQRQKAANASANAKSSPPDGYATRETTEEAKRTVVETVPVPA